MARSEKQADVSRRRFGRPVLLGGTGAAASAVNGAEPAAAAPAAPWVLGGNSGIATDGSEWLGSKNNAPLVIKTHGVERARFLKTGPLLVKDSVGISAPISPTARLNVLTDNTTGLAVLGTAPNDIGSATNAIGVQGVGTVGVQGTGAYMGVQGTSTNYAVFGYTSPDTGGIGTYGRGAIGVKGRSYSGQAVLGDTDSGVGVKGESYSDGGSVKAIHGEAFGLNNNAVVGTSNNGSSAYGVWGVSTSGYAGVFSGKVLVTGALSKGGGSFKIDHPLDPRNKYLYHSFVESPDMMNVYNGNVHTNTSGTATVKLPDDFMALNRDFRYQLTVIGECAQAIVAKEIKNGSFTIRTDKPNVKVSWQVTGIRQDAWANVNRIPTAVDKTESERGTYLHPEAFGEPLSRSFDHARIEGLRPTAMRRLPDPVPPR